MEQAIDVYRHVLELGKAIEIPGEAGTDVELEPMWQIEDQRLLLANVEHYPLRPIFVGPKKIVEVRGVQLAAPVPVEALVVGVEVQPLRLRKIAERRVRTP